MKKLRWTRNIDASFYDKQIGRLIYLFFQINRLIIISHLITQTYYNAKVSKKHHKWSIQFTFFIVHSSFLHRLFLQMQQYRLLIRNKLTHKFRLLHPFNKRPLIHVQERSISSRRLFMIPDWLKLVKGNRRIPNRDATFTAPTVLRLDTIVALDMFDLLFLEVVFNKIAP